MQIFVTDICPIQSARNLDDRRVNKMLLESIQLLSTAMHLSGESGPYRLTHQNHPCAVWVRESKANYDWLVRHAEELLAEFYRRRRDNGKAKVHACEAALLVVKGGGRNLPAGPLTSFVNCTSGYRELSSTIDAYRMELADKWERDKLKPTFYGV